MSIENEAVKTLVELGAKAPTILNDGCIPVVVIPADQKIESLEHFYPLQRIKRTVYLLEADSFIEYVNRFKGSSTLIFSNVTETGVEFTAMLDYHGAAPGLEPSYCSHIAKFTAIETPEWRTWKGANRQSMNQVTFATWLEDNAGLFVEPSGASLLELVRSLHGHKNARFNQAVRLDNGAHSVSYDEDIVIKSAVTTTNGEMTLPPVIKAGLAVFQGAAAYKVEARLKTRLEDRRLTLYFETIALHKIVRESILLLVKQVADKTKIIPLLGNP